MSDFTRAGWIFTGAARTSIRWRCDGEQEEQLHSSLEDKTARRQTSSLRYIRTRTTVQTGRFQ